MRRLVCQWRCLGRFNKPSRLLCPSAPFWPAPDTWPRQARRFARRSITPKLERLEEIETQQVALSQPSSFAQLPLSDATQQALRESFGYTTMSDVQVQVLPVAFSDNSDLVVRARTGTGKTLAFLIPAVEQLLKTAAGRGIAALVIAPTRELAIQIGNEAELLLSAQYPPMGVVTLIGGVSSMRQDQLAIRRKKPRVMVATPGRLIEHLERTFLFPSLFEGLTTLVLDEADRLLELGFLDNIKEIISYLPVARRSMLFSATISPKITDIVARLCRGKYKVLDCVGEGESATGDMLDQSFVALPGHQCLGALYNLLMGEMSRDRYGYKILVFFPTARLTAFMAHFFRQQLRIGVYEIHRRRDAEARLATQERFKADTSGILFSSDVSARGMDYPNVTLVVQFGAPATREMYIHRVGRTARAGKEGRSVLLLGELERGFLRAVEDVPLAPYDEGGAGDDPLLRVNELLVQATSSWVSSAPLRAAATAAFASLLVHYKATHRVLRMADDDIIQAASDVLLGCGLVDQPVVSKRLAFMLGLENHPKLICVARFGEEFAEPTFENGNSRRRRASWRG